MDEFTNQSARVTDSLIAAEIGRQDRMWGETNDRADISKGQLFHAAQAQILFLDLLAAGNSKEDAVMICLEQVYPPDWSGFRDYGSGIANLVVAAAYLRQEIVRRIRNGESTFRSSRDPVAQPYTADQPNVIEP